MPVLRVSHELQRFKPHASFHGSAIYGQSDHAAPQDPQLMVCSPCVVSSEGKKFKITCSARLAKLLSLP